MYPSKQKIFHGTAISLRETEPMYGSSSLEEKNQQYQKTWKLSNVNSSQENELVFNSSYPAETMIF